MRPRRRSRPVEVLCVCCGGLGRHSGRRLCKTCYSRHHLARTLDRHPVLGYALPKLWRVESYAELRGRGLSVRDAAERLGVSDRTGTRYEVQLKAAASHDDTRSEAA